MICPRSSRCLRLLRHRQHYLDISVKKANILLTALFPESNSCLANTYINESGIRTVSYGEHGKLISKWNLTTGCAFSGQNCLFKFSCPTMHLIDTHFSACHLLGFRATVEKKIEEVPAFTWLILVRKKNMKSFQSGNARREAKRLLPYQKAFLK